MREARGLRETDSEGMTARPSAPDLRREAPDNLSHQSEYATALMVCGGSRDEARWIADALATQDRPGVHGQHQPLPPIAGDARQRDGTHLADTRPARRGRNQESDSSEISRPRR